MGAAHITPPLRRVIMGAAGSAPRFSRPRISPPLLTRAPPFQLFRKHDIASRKQSSYFDAMALICRRFLLAAYDARIAGGAESIVMRQRCPARKQHFFIFHARLL